MLKKHFTKVYLLALLCAAAVYGVYPAVLFCLPEKGRLTAQTVAAFPEHYQAEYLRTVVVTGLGYDLWYLTIK